MQTKYRVTGIRKGDKTAKVITFHDTKTEADWWTINHMIEENNSHAYQVAQAEDSEEGYRTHSAYYVVDGRIVNESVYLQAVKG